MAGKFLKFFSPFIRIMPEIKQPQREVSFKEKFIWTVVVLIIYLIMSTIPLYGVDLSESTDYYYWLRVILASQRGTLTELGIGPIVTAGLIMQLLIGSKMIKINMADPYDRAMFSGAQKVMAMFLTVFNIIVYLINGAFGPNLGLGNMVFIILQLLVAGLIIILLDELLQKGWGLGSGVSLFIATGVAGQIFWNCFSFLGSPITFIIFFICLYCLISSRMSFSDLPDPLAILFTLEAFIVSGLSFSSGVMLSIVYFHDFSL